MPVSPDGRISFSVSALPLGSYALTIAYSGDANQTSLVSSEFPLHITAAPTHLSLQGPSGMVVSGQEVELNASVSSHFAAGTPLSGTVIFTDNGIDVGTANVDASGHASLMIPQATLGPHAYAAAYSGDGDYQFSLTPTQKSGEPARDHRPRCGPSAGFVAPGQFLVLIVNLLLPPPAQGAPSGTITFRDGGQVLATLPVNNADGEAILTTGLSRRGFHRITAQYSGDALDAPAISNPLLEFVTP